MSRSSDDDQVDTLYPDYYSPQLRPIMKTMKRSKMVNDEAKIKQNRRALYIRNLKSYFRVWLARWRRKQRVDRDDLNQWYIDTRVPAPWVMMCLCCPRVWARVWSRRWSHHTLTFVTHSSGPLRGAQLSSGGWGAGNRVWKCLFDYKSLTIKGCVRVSVCVSVTSGHFIISVQWLVKTFKYLQPVQCGTDLYI